MLDARGIAWMALPPMHVARHSHSATLLAGGRVLVAGGVGVDGRPVCAVEMWDPIAGGWMEGPELPLGLYGHAAVRLSSGAVLVAGGGWVTAHGGPVPWAWSWSPQSAAWQLAGQASPADEREMSSPVSMSARPDGSALVLLPLVEFVRSIPAEGWRQIGQGVQEAAHAATTPTRRPCNLIGIWSSTHRGVLRRIELKDDGRYVMAPSMLGIDPPGGYTGQWTVQDDKIVWRDDKTGAVDVNPMLEVSDGRFEVTEGDGRRTQFERIEAKTSARCDKT